MVLSHGHLDSEDGASARKQQQGIRVRHILYSQQTAVVSQARTYTGEKSFIWKKKHARKGAPSESHHRALRVWRHALKSSGERSMRNLAAPKKHVPTHPLQMYSIEDAGKTQDCSSSKEHIPRLYCLQGGGKGLSATQHVF